MISKNWVRNNNLGYTKNVRNHRVSKAVFALKKAKNKLEDKKEKIGKAMSKLKPKREEVELKV